MAVQRMFKYRLYPSRKQKAKIINSLKVCKTIYNELLALNIDSWKFGKVSLSGFDCNKYLTGKYMETYSQVKQNVSDRVHKAFKNFFRRVKDKSCKKKGFPRFKSRIKSITYPQSGFKFLNNKRLQVSKIGSIPIILHRVPKGKIKTMTIKVNRANQWFVCFSCEVDIHKVRHTSNEKIGIDVGITNFATLSNGNRIDNPRFLVNSEKRLKLLQRKVSRKKKGSKNRRKARFRLAKRHIKIVNQRTDWLHKLSRSLTIQYGTIAVEDLSINGMVHNHHLAKHINDASWDTFIRMLDYKEVMLGGQCIKVNPRGTSKTCSNCGNVMDMPLSKIKFKCSNCGFVCHRDLNASLNINDRAGLARISTPVDIEPLCHHHDGESSVVEAGTISDNR